MMSATFANRLGNLYVAAFGLLTAAFYITLIETGYEARLALLACTAAALACVLERIAARTVVPKTGYVSYSQRTLLSEAALHARIEEFRHRPPSSTDLGLMVVAISSPQDRNQTPAPSVLGFLQRQLALQTNSSVYKLDGRTLAIVERRSDAASHLEKITTVINASLRHEAATTRQLAQIRLVVGVGLTNNRRLPSTELLAAAIGAIHLAEIGHVDRFFRRL